MTCLEAQSKIIAYIDHDLERDEKQDFLKHIQCCSDCKEELNIYYTMIEGMRQLDENMPLSRDFTQELNNRMERELKSSRKKRDFFRSSVVLTIVAAMGFLIFGYVNFLNLLHEQEQAALKQAQGEYYYSQTFDDILFLPETEQIVQDINISSEEESESSFYEKIRQHNYLKQ